MPIRILDQERARLAYRLVEGMTVPDRKNYKIAVNSLGANVVRLGLSASLAELQRRGSRGGDQLLAHLADTFNEFKLTGLGEGLDAGNIVASINHLEAMDYMLATRQLLQFSSWLKRAVQAWGDDEDDGEEDRDARETV